MCSMRVLALLALLVGSAHCFSTFSWDIVVGEDKRLDFYYNGTLTHTEDIPSARLITSVTYDPVNYRVLFADYYYPKVSIYSLHLSTRYSEIKPKIQPVVTSDSYGDYIKVVYDPVTQLLFWKDDCSIYSFPLDPTCYYKADYGNLIVTLDHHCWDIAVDSCGGYIYWITTKEVSRARFDGSEKSVLISKNVYNRGSLAIDQQTQKMYWTEVKRVNGEYQLSIESADFNGKNRKIVHIIARENIYGYSLAVSKDIIYWKNQNEVGIWQLPKIPSKHVEGKLFSKSSSDNAMMQRIAANYTIQEQIQGTKGCEALQRLIPIGWKPESSICQNYCFQGDCSVSAEGQPSCSCKAGYSGERCEVNACHMHCLNNGVCSLNEENEAVCECTADYEGVRCDVATTCSGVHAKNTTLQVLPDLRKEVSQVIKEELKRILQFFSDKIEEYQAKI